MKPKKLSDRTGVTVSSGMMVIRQAAFGSIEAASITIGPEAARNLLPILQKFIGNNDAAILRSKQKYTAERERK